MAVAQYYAWDHEGRPLNPAQPIREFVEKMKVAYPKAAGTFGWYADEAHYQAVPPLDHTPYSYSGWPLQNPYPYVFATDVMHRPDLGVDCNVLFPYWLAEAKAGRTPWLKYLIWQAKVYSVRNNWAPQSSSGHFDHIHLSDRTDHKDTSLGSWSPAPAAPVTGDNDMPSILLTNAQHLYLANGFDLKGIMTEADLNALRTAFPGPDRIVSQADVDKGLFGTVHGDTPPVIITPEQLAAIAAAAKAGAEAGAPTHEELVDAAEEGANKAEDS